MYRCFILADIPPDRLIAVGSDNEPVSIQLGKAASALFEHHPVTMEMGNRLHWTQMRGREMKKE